MTPIDIAAAPGSGPNSGTSPRSRERSATGFDAERATRLAVLATVVAAFGFVLQRGQDVNFDLLAYHYYSGWAFLAGRLGVDIAGPGIGAFLNPLPNVLSYLAYAKLAFPWSAWSLLAVQLLALPLIVAIGRRIGASVGLPRPGPAALFAFAIAIASPLWWSELGTSFYSATTAPLVLAGVLLQLRAASVATTQAQAAAALFLGGACIGVATGLKLTNAIFGVAMVAACVPLALRRGWRSGLLAAASCGAGGVAGLATMAWWHADLVRRWDSFLFPFYNAWFRSPYFDAVNIRDGRWMFETPGKFVDFLAGSLRGTNVTSEIPFVDPRLLVVALLALAAVGARARQHALGAPRMDAAAATLLWFTGASVALWAYVFAYQRYLIPVELLLGATSWVLLNELLRKPARVAAGLIALATLAWSAMTIPNWGHLPSQRGATGNPFGTALPPPLADQPATYLVAGTPLGFLLPAFAPGSRFYRIDIAPGMDNAVKRALAQPQPGPLRVLAMAEMRGDLAKLVAPFGYEIAEPCATPTAHVGKFVACDLRPRGARDSRPAGVTAPPP